MDKTDFAPAAAKSALPFGMLLTSLLGISLNDLVLLTSLFFILLQSAFLIWKWIRLARGWKKPDA